MRTVQLNPKSEFIFVERTQMGFPAYLDILQDGIKVGQFYYNMRGYNQDFFLKDADGNSHYFGGDKSKTIQIKAFKSAIKLGFIFLTAY